MRSTENSVRLAIIIPWPSHVLLFQPPWFGSADGSSPCSCFQGPPPSSWALGGGGVGRNAPVLWGAEELPCLQGVCHPTQVLGFPPYDSSGKGYAKTASFEGAGFLLGGLSPGLRKERGQYWPLSAHISLWSAQVQAHADPGQC